MQSQVDIADQIKQHKRLMEIEYDRFIAPAAQALANEYLRVHGFLPDGPVEDNNPYRKG